MIKQRKIELLAPAKNLECGIEAVNHGADAVKYLKKEALLLPSDIEKGYVLVCYNDFPLGFVKHLGNRANNLYPQEWRIRSGYLPDKVILFPGE